MIRYTKISQFACDVTFGIFLVSWFITRHILFIFVIKAVYDLPKFLEDFNPTVLMWFNGLLWTLQVMSNVSLTTASSSILFQVLQLVWFWMICRVAWRVVSGRGATDERSED